TAAGQRRRAQPAITYPEQIAEDALDRPTGLITDQPLGIARLLPLVACQYLLQAIEMLESGQQRLLSQLRAAGEEFDALLAVFRRIGRQWRAQQDVPARDVDRRGIATQAVTSGQQQFDDARLQLPAEGCQFAAQTGFVEAQGQTLATVAQARQVPLEQCDAAGAQRHGFKETVVVCEPAIGQGKPVGGLSIHPAERQPWERQ